MGIYPISYKSKYERWYYNIIKNAKCQQRFKGGDIYYEGHHIIPKSLGGLDSKENIVLLSGREHFICHWLLYKFSEGIDKHKMAHAWFMMYQFSKFHKSRYSNSLSYEIARKAHCMAVSENLKGIPRPEEVKQKISKSNSGKKKSIEHREKLSVSHKGKKLSKTHRENVIKARIGVPRKETTKMKISQTKTGIKHSESHKLKNSEAKKGENNPQFTGYFVTPWGKFSSSVDAANCAPYKCNPPLIRRWCKDNNEKIFTRPKFSDWAGKTPAQLGFGFDRIS
jgi:hypothetical protein